MVVWDLWELPKSLGIYGGGGFDFRFGNTPMAGSNTFPGEPTWGSEWKKRASANFSRTLNVYGHLTSLPVATNRVDLDPATKDAWGLPVPRLTFKGHPEDFKLGKHFVNLCKELIVAAGAIKSTPWGGGPDGGGPHLLGSCRVGKNPQTSRVNADHRAHDVKTLFIVDGSSFVPSGRGQPTMTI